MTQHGRITFGFSLLFLFSFLHARPVSAQTINDPAQNEKYGIWKVMNPQYPGIQTRAKCNFDTDLNGRTQSNWGFQVTSTYTGTMDYVYLVEFGSPLSHVNEMTGPFMTTAKPGDITEGSTELYGICGEHTTVKTGLRIQIRCAVPTGQDAPCFKDSNGNPYERRNVSDVAAKLKIRAAPGSSGSTNSKSGQRVAFWYCEVRTDYDNLAVTNLFKGSADSGDSPAHTDYESQFASWVSGHYGSNQHASGCERAGDTEAQAEQARNKSVQEFQAIDRAFQVSFVQWSPQ
jgi:hypothetical protein